MTPLRINLVLGHQIPLPPTQGGGINNLVWMLAKQFAARGNRVTAYSPTAAGLAPHEVDAHGITHVRVPGAAMRQNVLTNNLWAFPYSLRLLPKLQPADITSFHTPFSFLLRRAPGLGVCTHTIHRTPKSFSRIYGALDRVYAGSHAVVQQAIEIAPSLGPKLKAIHNCIALPNEPPDSPVTEEVTLLYVGRFVPDKGLESLLRGFLEVTAEEPRLRLRFIGPQTAVEGADPEFFTAMRTLVAAHPQADRVSFEPSIYDREKLFGEIRKASAFCLPSLTGETFSMAGLEAMSCAKPLFVSDFGPMIEMVDHLQTGYIAKAGDPAAWAAGARFFAWQRDLIPELGLHSFQKARDSFSVEIIAEKYLSDFHQLIAEKR